MAGANAADAGRSAGTAASSGVNVNKNSGALGNDIGAQKANLAGAQSKCEAAKQQCDSKCDQAKSQAQAAAAGGDKSAQADVGQIPGIKSGQCDQPLDGKIAQLQQGQSNLGNDGKQAGDTKNASQNGMPPISPPQGGGGDKGKNDPQQAQQGAGLDCNGIGTERVSDCNNQYIQKCKSDPNGAGCFAFSNRYCNIGGNAASAGVANSAPLTGAMSNLVADKTGEGLGSDYCQQVNAQRFCQQGGRGQCPSCMQLAGNTPASSTAAMNTAAQTCPGDPMFINAGLVNKGTSSSGTAVTNPGSTSDSIKAGIGGTKPGVATGGGAPSGGSGGGMGTGSGSAAGVTVPESVKRGTAATEGSPNGISMSVGGEGGGGGGGSEPFNPGADDGASGPGALNPFSAGDRKKLQPMAPAAGVAAKDVSNPYGPSIFTIGSQAYRNYCSKAQIWSCFRK
jgi:hypothetical protein